MRSRWPIGYLVNGLLILVLIPVGVNLLPIEKHHWSAWIGLAIVVVTVPVALIGGYRVQWETSLFGRSDLEASANALAAAVLAAEREQRTLLLGGDTRTAMVRFERDPIHYRDAGGQPAGNLETVLDYYRELRPGRMVILGAPGSGKTVLAVELLIRMLEQRIRTGTGPVPVRLNLAGWDTSRSPKRGHPLERWITDRLVAVYRLPPPLARSLVSTRRILPILDGLDEMDSADGLPLRAGVALRYLNSYLESRGRAPMVLTCRRETYRRLQQAGMALVDATAVRIWPLEVDHVVAYLQERVRDWDEEVAWASVLRELSRAPTGVLASLLSTPWRLALATTVARAFDPTDLLRHTTRENLDRELLARFIPAVTTLYPRARERGHYDPAAVTEWLARLAKHLDHQIRDGSRTDILPYRLWTVAGVRCVRWLHVVVGLLGVLAFADFAVGTLNLAPALYTVAVLAIAAMIGLDRNPTLRQGDLRYLFTKRGTRQAGLGLALGLPAGLSAALVFGVLPGLDGWASVSRAVQGFGFGLLLAPLFGLVFGLGAGVPNTLTPQEPLQKNLRFGIAVGLAFWLIYGLFFWPVYEIVYDTAATFGFASIYGPPIDQQYEKYGPLYGFSSGIVGDLPIPSSHRAVLGCVLGILEALVFGLVFASTAWTRYAIAVTVAASRRHLPWRLGEFLAWAHHGGLLRASGVAYQFRHLELQEWLRR